MQLRAVPSSWVAAAALTVLSSAGVAALVLPQPPVAAPAAAPAPRVVAAYQAAPVPLSLSFPAAPAPVRAAAAPVRVRAAPVAAPAARAATAPRTCSGPGWQARRGAAAVASLRRPADAAAVRVVFRPARADVLGMADLRLRRVDVYVRSCASESDALLRHVVAHELGHVLDVTRMTPALRAEWLAARGIPAGTPWFGCDRCADFATPAGDFAETYAQWQRGSRTSRSQLAPAPSRAQLERLAARFFPAL